MIITMIETVIVVAMTNSSSNNINDSLLNENTPVEFDCLITIM